MRICDITQPTRVLSWSEKDQQFQLSLSGGSFPKGKANLYRVTTQSGEFVASGHHLVFSSSHNYLKVQDLSAGQELETFSLCLHGSSEASDRLLFLSSGESYTQTDVDYLGDYADAARLYGLLLHSATESDLTSAPLTNDVRRSRLYSDLLAIVREDDLPEQTLERIRRDLFSCLQKKNRLARQMRFLSFALASRISASPLERICDHRRTTQQSLLKFSLHRSTEQRSLVDHSSVFSSTKSSTIISVKATEEEDLFFDLQVMGTNNYVTEDGCIHHNSGKTEAAVLRCIIGKMQYPTLNRGFYEPTYDLVRMIAWPRFEDILSQLEIPYRLYKSPLNYIEIEGAGKIIFRSMDTPQRIIGYEHADADLDELDTLKAEEAAEVWRRVLSRNRQVKPDGKPNTMGVTTTPEGFRFVYRTWKQMPKPGYTIIQAPTASNPHLPAGYIDSLKDLYPDALLEAYLNGEFVNLTSGTVYRSYNRNKHRSAETYQKGEPVFIGMDFNIDNMAATIYVMRDKAFHAVDQITKGYNTPAVAEMIKQRYEGSKIIIYPDSSGKNRTRMGGVSQSDIAILENEYRFECRYHSTNPRVRDRINATNAAFENGHLFVNDLKCPDVAACYEQQSYDNNGEPDKSSGLDHQNDASTYPIAYELPILRPVANVKIGFAY